MVVINAIWRLKICCLFADDRSQRDYKNEKDFQDAMLLSADIDIFQEIIRQFEVFLERINVK